MSKTYPVSEIFGPTIQGEGPFIGTLTHFLRFAGCDFDCSWCDTKYAVGPRYVDWHKDMMTDVDIVRRINEQGNVQQVTISGGNPGLFLDVPLLALLDLRGFYATVETQGTKFNSDALAYPNLRHLIISPKPPSSRMSNRMSTDVVGSMIARRNRVPRTTTTLKYVVFNDEDLEWVKRFDSGVIPTPSYKCISVGTTVDSTCESVQDDILAQMRWIIDKIKDDDYFVFNHFRVTPQLHTLLWGRKRGV